jgi:hypothetical protein
VRSVERQEPVAVNTLFQIGSVALVPFRVTQSSFCIYAAF